jgi:hypothetical protein
MASRLMSCASRPAWGLVARSSFDEAYATPRLPAFFLRPKRAGSKLSARDGRDSVEERGDETVD